MLEPASLLLAAAAALLGATVQGSVGFGFALVAAPLFVLIDPQFVPGAATVAAAGLGLIGVVGTRGGPTDWPGVRWAGAGLVPGSIGAGVLLASLSVHAVAITVAVLILVAVLLSLSGFKVHRKRSNLLLAGTISGFMGTASAVGGPPIALVYQDEPGPVIRATLFRYFSFGSAVAIAVLIPAGRLGVDELVAGVALLPGVALGFGLSTRLAGFLDSGWTRPAVLVVSAASSVAVLLRELL